MGSPTARPPIGPSCILQCVSVMIWSLHVISPVDSNLQLAAVFLSNHSSPADSSQLGISLEQALPLHSSWLNFNRLRIRAEQPVPFGPFTLNLRGKAGSVYGDLPPYEAFPLGGTNSVRGYAEGGVGSGRHFIEGTAELR